ncbi:hypothetical protein [Croceicoccus gelatinilyticus]|uniref:hypothetical protein n=1 Tax=Croceicoccus gelatinilyticus TaxID=2835536 RepID=UPI001BCF03C4|nr:hypothetical protein [Croceicoccus gelatinilyticus]MBS7670173.1 hypothetical protein [Croceicoccus gelatinilyticus]
MLGKSLMAGLALCALLLAIHVGGILDLGHFVFGVALMAIGFAIGIISNNATAGKSEEDRAD